MRVLVVNAGSTTVKLSVLDGEAERFATTIEHSSPTEAVARGVDAVQVAGLLPVDAVGHRVVHGGAAFSCGVRLTDDVLNKLAPLSELAPLHNPPALDAIAAAQRLLPDVPHAAAFDTAFHRTMSPTAEAYALPARWTDEWGVRKFGFHGLSHAYCSRRAAEMLGRTGDPTFRVVVAHLGGGCSLCAVRGGAAVDTTMGFTPLDGLVMATRCGSIDPGALLHVMRAHRLSVDEVDHALNKESGLLGASGLSGDMRELRAAAGGAPRVAAALALFEYRLRLGVGAMAAALGGLDALVFTAGVGEHDRALRLELCSHLGHLGIAIDPDLNAAVDGDGDVSATAAPCRTLVVHTREDVTIARDVARAISIC